MKLTKLIILIMVVMLQAESGDVNYRLGLRFKKEGKYELAIEKFRRAVGVHPDNYKAYLQLGEVQEALGNTNMAEHNYLKALEFNPGWKTAYLKLSKVYEKSGKKDQAVSMLQMAQRGASITEKKKIALKINKIVGRDTKTAPKVTKKYKKTKKRKTVRKVVILPAARDELSKAIRSYRDGVRNGSDKSMKEALKHISKSLSISPGYPGAFYYAGVIRRYLKQPEMARINFHKGTNDPEMGFNAHFYLGKIYGEREEFDKAVEHLKKYRESSDYEPGRRESLTLIESYKRKSEMAKERAKVDFEQISTVDIEREIITIPNKEHYSEIEIRISPELSMVIVDTITDGGNEMLKAVHLFNDKKYDESIEEFNKVMGKYPTGAIASNSLYDIGICQMKLHDWDGASRTFSKYQSRFTHGSQYGSAMFFEALSYREMKKNTKSEKIFKKYINKNVGKEWLGKSYEKLGDIFADRDLLGRAADNYEKAQKYSYSSIDKMYSSFKLGKALEQLGNWSDGEKAYNKVISTGKSANLNTRVPDSYYRLADYKYKIGEYKSAEELYIKAGRIFKDYKDTPWGIFQLANISKNLNQLQDAIKGYDNLISKYPDDYWAKQAQWKRSDAVWQYEYGQK